MDFSKKISEIEKKIQYTFKDKSLLTQAFTRTSFCNERNRGHRGEEYISNEVLEFFGDSVLSTAIISMLLNEKTERYEHGIYTELDEGDFSNIRSKLSDKRNLSKSMATLGLQRYLRMGEGDGKLGIENEPSVMEDLFESIVGAVYIDCGMDIKRVIKVVSVMLDVSSYFSAETPPVQSFKNALQEWCADKKRRLPPPVYKTLSETGPDHKRSYERAVVIGDRTYGVGKGKNLKIADSMAAEEALKVLMREDKATDCPDVDYLTKLRNFASKNKQPSPEFRDLGETPESTEYAREFIIECRFMGKCTRGVARSKQEARAIAAKNLLSELEGKNKSEKKPKTEMKKTKSKEKQSKGQVLPIEKNAPALRLERGVDKAREIFNSAEKKGENSSKKKASLPQARERHKPSNLATKRSHSPKKQPYQHKKHQ